jgi:signal peptidase II
MTSGETDVVSVSERGRPSGRATPARDADDAADSVDRAARGDVSPDARSVYLSRVLFFGAVAIVLLLDQVTKAWVVANLPAYRPVNVIPWLAPILSFTSVENTGVAFGLFPGLGSLFTLLALVVVIGIFFFMRTLPASDLWVHLSLGLVTGGALGNVLDRFLRGYVVDFLDVNFWPLATWPVFNLADSAIVVGVFILLVDSFLAEPEAF